MAVSLWTPVPTGSVSKKPLWEEINTSKESSQGISELRRSPRLAVLLLLKPISYKETRPKRVFKKVRRRPRVVESGEERTDVQLPPCSESRSGLLVAAAVLTLAVFAGLGFKVMSEQSSETLDHPGKEIIQKTSGGTQNLDDFQETTDGLHERPAHPGHGVVPPRLALCDGVAPLLCTQKLLSASQEILGQNPGRQTQEENFALKSSGASVVRYSKPFYSGAKLCKLGFCWNYSRSPDVILERCLTPGHCWAMDGAQGYVVIKLSEAIRPTAVTLDHISKMASPYGMILSAPREFAIYGLKNALEQEKEGALLGSFVYKNDSFPVQLFRLKSSKEDQFPYLMVQILSNHGHPNYTCVYGVRVHGQRIKKKFYHEQDNIAHIFQLIKARLLERFRAA